MNFQESTRILNACTKKSGNLLNASCIYIYIYMCVCVCVCAYIYTNIYITNTLGKGMNPIIFPPALGK